MQGWVIFSSLPLWGFCTNLSDVFYKVTAPWLASEIIISFAWLTFMYLVSPTNFCWIKKSGTNNILLTGSVSVMVFFCSIVTFRLWNQIVKIRYGGIGTVLSISGRVIELDLWMSKRQKYILTDGTENPRFTSPYSARVFLMNIYRHWATFVTPLPGSITSTRMTQMEKIWCPQPWDCNYLSREKGIFQVFMSVTAQNMSLP